MGRGGGLRAEGGFSGLLKDGYKHLSGLEEAVLKNTEAVVALSNIMRTSFGPNGMNKLLVNHLERLFVTSDAATIVSELEVQHPAAKMVAMTAKRQQEEFGDFTNFVITFSGELMKQAQDLIRVGVHVADIIEGYKVAGERALAFLPDLIQEDAEITDVRDPIALRRALFPVIMAKQYGQEELITPLIVQACQQTLQRSGAPSINTDNIRVAKLMGGAL
jgi:T-complex protein 1 subunit theta|tara:strand:- start:42 stop:698 length:657 start_codon:yes stop_codon:yes gene_type:complete